MDAGSLNTLLIEIVKVNSREPVANEGDIYALIACCETGAKRLAGMMDEFGIDHLDDLAEYIIGTSYRGTIEAIAELPKGTWHNVLKVDGYEQEIDLHAALTIADDHILLDFDGTSGPSNKGINVPLNYATAYSVFALRCIIGPDIPNNAGSLAPFLVTGPKDCILNAQPPSPVAMRHTLGQMTPDLVYGCLSQVLPDQVPAEGASCMYDLPLRHVPEAASQGGEQFALELVFSGGTGARPGLDGLSATAFPSGVWGSQVETTEAVAPVLITRRELRPDSGGAGVTRGGLGQQIEVQSSNGEDFLLFLSVERIVNPARGRSGGSNGATGRIRVGRDGPNLPGKGEVRVKSGETLIFETPGGGGFGPPHERSREEILRDLREGLVSEKAAREIYGFEP